MPTDERRTDGDPSTGTRRGTGALLLVLVGLVAAVGVGWRMQARPEPSEMFCADVGVIGPTGATPEEALDRWLVTQHPELTRQGWTELRASTDSVSFEPPAGATDRYQSVQVSRSDVLWSATGACV
jgi:hypothetical protein